MTAGVHFAIEIRRTNSMGFTLWRPLTKILGSMQKSQTNSLHKTLHRTQHQTPSKKAQFSRNTNFHFMITATARAHTHRVGATVQDKNRELFVFHLHGMCAQHWTWCSPPRMRNMRQTCRYNGRTQSCAFHRLELLRCQRYNEKKRRSTQRPSELVVLRCRCLIGPMWMRPVHIRDTLGMCAAVQILFSERIVAD